MLKGLVHLEINTFVKLISFFVFLTVLRGLCTLVQGLNPGHGSESAKS